MWDPNSYLRYREERGRPFHDLLARVPARRPRSVVDLGCGPGNLTVTLAEHWPEARVDGIDASAEMIRQAATLDSPVRFTVGDLRDWTPTPEVDVVLANAVLQWVPGHQALLLRWAAALAPGAVLAVQVPGNLDAASHRTLREVAGAGPWRDAVEPLLRGTPVPDALGYATLLTDAGCAVDAWETTYVHLLTAPDDADHPVLTWLEGTALRPVRTELGGDSPAWAEFRARLGERLAGVYPVRDGLVYFPFHRVFFVARTGPRAVAGTGARAGARDHATPSKENQ